MKNKLLVLMCVAFVFGCKKMRKMMELIFKRRLSKLVM